MDEDIEQILADICSGAKARAATQLPGALTTQTNKHAALTSQTRINSCETCFMCVIGNVLTARAAHKRAFERVLQSRFPAQPNTPHTKQLRRSYEHKQKNNVKETYLVKRQMPVSTGVKYCRKWKVTHLRAAPLDFGVCGSTAWLFRGVKRRSSSDEECLRTVL